MTDRNRDESHRLKTLTEAVCVNVGFREDLGRSAPLERPILERVKTANCGRFTLLRIFKEALDIFWHFARYKSKVLQQSIYLIHKRGVKGQREPVPPISGSLIA